MTLLHVHTSRLARTKRIVVFVDALDLLKRHSGIAWDLGKIAGLWVGFIRKVTMMLRWIYRSDIRA